MPGLTAATTCPWHYGVIFGLSEVGIAEAEQFAVHHTAWRDVDSRRSIITDEVDDPIRRVDFSQVAWRPTSRGYHVPVIGVRKSERSIEGFPVLNACVIESR